MMGSTLSTTSLSTASFSRSTPWVLGCWGPMLRPISLNATVPPPEREVFAQRMALELVRHVDAAQAGMAYEADAEHVKGLPLGPIGGAVDLDDRVEALVLPDLNGQPEPVRGREPEELVKDGEPPPAGGRGQEVVEDDKVF